MAVRSTPRIPIDTLAYLLAEPPLVSSDLLEEVPEEDEFAKPTVEMSRIQLQQLLVHERTAHPNVIPLDPAQREVILLDTPKREDSGEVVLLDTPKVHGPDAPLDTPDAYGADPFETLKLRKGYGFIATFAIAGGALGAMLASLLL